MAIDAFRVTAGTQKITEDGEVQLEADILDGVTVIEHQTFKAFSAATIATQQEAFRQVITAYVARRIVPVSRRPQVPTATPLPLAEPALTALQTKERAFRPAVAKLANLLPLQGSVPAVTLDPIIAATRALIAANFDETFTT